MKYRSAACLLALVIAAGCGPTQNPGPPPPGVPSGLPPSQGMLDAAANRLNTVRDGFLQWYVETHPVRATELGIHTQDHRLPDLTRRGMQDRIDDLLVWLADLERIRFDLMRGGDRYDYAVMEYGIRAELLALEESREWATDPRVYTATIARGLASIAQREYAPLDERLPDLVARLNGAPALLTAARENVRTPPRIWTEIAIADARALAGYLNDGLPAQIQGPDGAELPASFGPARDRLAAALDRHIAWLENDLLPTSNGNFRLGQYLLVRKLRFAEHVAVGSVEELQRINRNAIAEYRQRMADAARAIDPDRTPRAILDSLGALHPAPDSLLDAARGIMEEARAWVASSGVVSLPIDASPEVRDSPPYLRDVFSSLDAPGPWDPSDLTAYYNLTNVADDWDASLQQQHLSHFSRGGLTATTLHETFPGRYVQTLHDDSLPDIRRVFLPTTFTGGWAHYAAEMALEEGFSGDPAITIGQLQRALQRHARWYAVIQLHALNTPIDEVVGGFMDIAMIPEFPARREVIRATRDPTYLAEALGRMQLRELRTDYQEYLEEREQEFSLPEFHDRLLRLGLPVPLAREALMPRDETPQTRRRPGRRGT